MALPRVELAAGQPVHRAIRVATRAARGPAPNGRTAAMGNAKWMGVRLKDVLDPSRRQGRVRYRYGLPGLTSRVVDGAAEVHEVAWRLDHAARRRGGDDSPTA